MYSELVLIIGSSPKTMGEAWKALTGNVVGQLFRLTDMVLIHRNKSGNVSFEIRYQESDRLINDDKRLAGDFAEAIFGQSHQDGHRRLTGAGMDPIFLRDITQVLQPNRLAYLFYLPAESRIDPEMFIKSLESLQGDLYRTTFDSRVEEALLKRNG